MTRQFNKSVFLSNQLKSWFLRFLSSLFWIVYSCYLHVYPSILLPRRRRWRAVRPPEGRLHGGRDRCHVLLQPPVQPHQVSRGPTSPLSSTMWCKWFAACRIVVDIIEIGTPRFFSTRNRYLQVHKILNCYTLMTFFKRCMRGHL